MMLDTHAVSALADGDTLLAARIAGVPRPALPAIALGEYLYGIGGSNRRGAYEGWLERHLDEFQVLMVDDATAHFYADVRRELRALGRPMPENDLWIAALARQYRLALVTRDRRFTSVPKLEVVAW